MDVFIGSSTQTNPNQIHDFNPGIKDFPSGLFWTIPFASKAVRARPGAGRASFSAHNSHERDFHNLNNSLANGPSDPATVSFNVEWGGVLDRGHLSDSQHKFRLDFVDTDATVTWSGRNDRTGATFVSGKNDSPAAFARLAHERNGRFFHEDDD